MLWLVAAGVCLVAIAYRWWTLEERPQLWWWAFSLTLIAIVIGTGLQAVQGAQDASTTVRDGGPGLMNFAYVGSDLAFLTAAGSVQIFVHCLRRRTRQRRMLAIHVGTAIAIAVFIMASWAWTSVHDQQLSTFGQDSMTEEPWAADVVFHVYLGAVLANVAVVSGQQLRTTPLGDTGRRIGLIMIGIGASVDVLAHVLYLVRTFIQSRYSEMIASRYESVADVLTLLALAAIAAGTITLVAVPRLVTHRRDRELFRTLRPLWHRVRELYPEVALPEPPLRLIPQPVGVRSERMLIEIQDALRLIMIDADSDPVTSTARVLVDRLDDVRVHTGPDATRGPRVAALTALPRLDTRQEEEDLLLRLADRYRMEARCAP